ncbi:MAG: SDR family NAD(P)-dependent oxidoreductase [Thermoleophilaceae bacterium]
MKLDPGTRVLITGASRGIGASLARALAERGCVLGLVARGEEGVRELAEGLAGDGHEPLAADVADRESIAAAVERFGRVDVVVANAGVAHYGPWLDLDVELEEQMTAINWLGTLHTVRAALGGMVERGRGHVVVISSGAALRTFPGAAVYGATKAAQRGFAEGLWHDLDGTGVGVTVVYPGEIGTSLHDHQPDKLPAWRRGGHEADVDECAAAIVAGVERDRRGVYFPREVRLLQTIHGISPRLADLMLRRLRGPSAAPRKW